MQNCEMFFLEKKSELPGKRNCEIKAEINFFFNFCYFLYSMVVMGFTLNYYYLLYIFVIYNTYPTVALKSNCKCLIHLLKSLNVRTQFTF